MFVEYCYFISKFNLNLVDNFDNSISKGVNKTMEMNFWSPFSRDSVLLNGVQKTEKKLQGMSRNFVCPSRPLPPFSLIWGQISIFFSTYVLQNVQARSLH